jgi:hypothetical protein
MHAESPGLLQQLATMLDVTSWLTVIAGPLVDLRRPEVCGLLMCAHNTRRGSPRMGL